MSWCNCGWVLYLFLMRWNMTAGFAYTNLDLQIASLYTLHQAGEQNRLCSEIVPENVILTLVHEQSVADANTKYLLDVGLSFTSRFADTCDDASFTLQQIVTLVGNSVYCGINEEQVKKNVNETYKYTIAGVGSFSGEIGMNINYLFQAFCIPVISGTTNSAALDNPSSYKYFMRAGASDIYKARTVLHFLQSQNWFHIIVISDSLSSGSAIRKLFKSYVSECIVANGKGSLFRRPCVEKYSELTFEGSQSESMLNADLAEIKSILKVSAVQTLVLFMSSKNVNLFLSLLTNWNIKPGTYQLILTDRDDLNISPHLNESYLIEEDVPHLPTFDTLIKINTISATTNPYVKELIQLQNVCCWNDVDDSVYEDTPQCAYSMPCHPDTTLNNIPLSARRQARLVYNAINVLAAGLRSFHQNFCVGIRGMCPSLVRNANGKTLMDFLKNASFYDENDQLVTMNGRSGKPAYNIYQFNGSAYHILMPAYNPFHGPTPKKENRDSFGSSLKDQVDKHNEDCQKNCRTSNAVPDMIDQCCWTCTPCTGPKSYLNDSMAICAQCKDDQIPKDDKSGCIDEPQPDMFVDMNAGKIVVLTGAGIGLILCLISLCFMYSQRQTPMYKASTPDLNCIQLTTTAILFLVSILMLPTSRQFLCASGWFLFSICTSILHSISFAKAVRIGRPPILDKSELISKDLRLSSHIFIFLSFLIQLIISMIWVLLRVPTIKPLLDRNRYCTSNTETQTTILFLFPSLFIIISFYPIHYALKNRYIFQVGQARVLLVSSLCNIASYLTLFIMLFTESLQGQPTTVVPVLLPVIPAYISFISITLSISWQMVFRKKQNLHEFISRERSRQFQEYYQLYKEQYFSYLNKNVISSNQTSEEAIEVSLNKVSNYRQPIFRFQTKRQLEKSKLDEEYYRMIENRVPTEEPFESNCQTVNAQSNALHVLPMPHNFSKPKTNKDRISKSNIKKQSRNEYGPQPCSYVCPNSMNSNLNSYSMYYPKENTFKPTIYSNYNPIQV